MRKPFFETSAQQACLVAVATDWLGTPFHPHAAVKGVGVDCVWLAAKVYITCGVLERFDPPRYTMDGGAHNQLSQVVAWLENSPAFDRIWTRGAFTHFPGARRSRRLNVVRRDAFEPIKPVEMLASKRAEARAPGKCQDASEPPLMIGDLLTFDMGKSAHHVGVVITLSQFLHVYRGYSAFLSNLRDSTWSRRLVSIYRPMTTTPHLVPQPHQHE
jgi:cell wall-associated NlpC family hydrolase